MFKTNSKYCFLKQIIKEEDILRLAKMMIDTSINIPDSVTSLDELINLFNF